MFNSPLFTVKIILPSETAASINANMVELPGEDGIIGVLHNHMPLIANLKNGIVVIHVNDRISKYYIHGGVARISNESVEILSDFALNLANINKSKIISELKVLELDLKQFKSGELNFEVISNKINRYKSCLEFMEK